MHIYIDGQFYGKADAKISVFDHGFLYGDGVFEGIRAYNRRIFKLDEHLERLFDSARAILLNIPLSFEELRQATIQTCAKNDIRDGYIRLVVSRGVGDLGMCPDKCPKASVIIIASTIQLYPEEFYKNGLSIVTASTRRVSYGSLMPAVKSLNYLNNIMAKLEGQQAGAQEVIMLNDQGNVAECSGDNVFAIKRGRLFTPPIYAGALGGITRQIAIDIAEDLSVPVSETSLTRYDLYVADEVFLTGTAAEVIPVVGIDGRTVGVGKPGPITLEVIRRFHHLTQTTGTPIIDP